MEYFTLKHMLISFAAGIACTGIFAFLRKNIRVTKAPLLLEERFNETENLYKLLITHMFEGVALHRMVLGDSGEPVDYRIVEVNDRYEKILGLNRNDVVGKLSRQAYATETVPYLAEYATVVRDKKTTRFDDYFAPLERYFSVSAIPWGEYGFATIFTDITEHKQMQDTLTKLNSELEERVARETLRRVTNEQILTRQSRHAAMGEMVGAIAHQWRQPLATVSVIIQNMSMAWKMDRLSREYVDQALQTAQSQIAYMTRTIEDFLTFFRSGKQKVEFCVNESVDESIRFMTRQFDNSGITVVRGEGFSQQQFVAGYPNELNQVMLNLLINACNAIRIRKEKDDSLVLNPGVIGIDITTFSDEVMITVSDNGCGIPYETGEKIFEPYFTTREHEGGTGIGLYMSRLIVVDGMGGGLSYVSNPGMTIFRINLPSMSKE